MGIYLFLFLLSFIEFPAFNAMSVDPDQTPHSAASDLGLNCLPMSMSWDTRHEYVKSIHVYLASKRDLFKRHAYTCFMKEHIRPIPARLQRQGMCSPNKAVIIIDLI